MTEHCVHAAGGRCQIILFFRLAGWAGLCHSFFSAGRLGWALSFFFVLRKMMTEASWPLSLFFAAHYCPEWAVNREVLVPVQPTCWWLGPVILFFSAGRLGWALSFFFFRLAGWAGPCHSFFCAAKNNDRGQLASVIVFRSTLLS